jgi:hypothetical protein
MVVIIWSYKGFKMEHMDRSVKTVRWSGATALLGSLLFALATLFHPVTIHPWSGGIAIHHMAESRSLWLWDHAVLTVALILWIMGLTGAELMIGDKGGLPALNASRLFIGSLVIWLVILSVELIVLPPMVAIFKDDPDPLLGTVISALFAMALTAGYFAFILKWLGVFLIGWRMRGIEAFSGWRAHWGWISGLLGILGIAAVLVLYNQMDMLLILVITNFPAFLWTCWLGWRMLAWR